MRLQALPLDTHTRALQSTLLHVGAINDSAAIAEFTLAAVLPRVQPWRAMTLTLQPQTRNQRAQPALQPLFNFFSSQTGSRTPSSSEPLLPISPWWMTAIRRLLPAAAPPQPAQPVVVSNGNVTLVFTEGQLSAATVNGVHLALAVQVQWYVPSDGSEAEDHGQCGGAYVLRLGPGGGPVGAPSLSVVEGALVSVVHQTWAPWASLVYRYAAVVGGWVLLFVWFLRECWKCQSCWVSDCWFLCVHRTA